MKDKNNTNFKNKDNKKNNTKIHNSPSTPNNSSSTILHSPFIIHHSSLVPKLRFPEFRDVGEWEVKRLGEIADVYQPETISQSELKEDGKYFVYGANGIIGKFERYNHKTQQIAVTCRGSTCGEVTLTKPYSWITGNSMVVNVDGKDNVQKLFIFYFLKNSDLRYLITGSGQPQITGDIKKHKIFIPSLPEQRKIADCLSFLDEVIELEAKKLKALEEYKKGLMQKLFPREEETTPRLRFPEFLDAGPWEVKRLGEVCRITNGSSNAQDHDDDGIYPLFDRSEIVKKSSKYLFDCEAVIIPGEGTSFVPKYYTGKFDLHQRSYALMDFAGYGRFVYYQMDALKNQLANKAVMSTVLSLRIPILEKFTITFPSLPEQQKIADCLSSLDEVIELQTKKLELLKAHKKGLMQKLFPQEVG